MEKRELVSIHPKEKWKEILYLNKEDFLNSKEIQENFKNEFKESNISKEDIEKWIKDIEYRYRPKIKIIKKSQEEKLQQEWVETDPISSALKDKQLIISLFFTKQGADFYISNWYFQIPLQLKSYWFDNETKVQITPNKEEKPDLDLHPDLQVEYDALFQAQEIPINILLEKVGKIVNESMLYDFEYIIASEVKGVRENKTLTEEKKIKEEQHIKETWDPQNWDYAPTGKETNKWVCYHAGVMIRDILSKIWLPPNIKYIEEAVKPWWPVDHDTTVVFDIHTGERAIINSKSPNKFFNLTRKKDLPQLWISS